MYKSAVAQQQMVDRWIGEMQSMGLSYDDMIRVFQLAREKLEFHHQNKSMLLGFKKQFIHPILSGIKGFTLRNERKVTPKIGETIYMYSGLRTAKCELITSELKLKYMYPVSLAIVKTSVQTDIDIRINGTQLLKKHHLLFVQMDGFRTVAEFVQYWTDCKEVTAITAQMMMYGWKELPKEWGVC